MMKERLIMLWFGDFAIGIGEEKEWKFVKDE